MAKTNWYKIKAKSRSSCKEEKGRSKTKSKGKKSTTTQVKAVLFVPRTKGGELAKRLRTEEENLEGITGYRLKIVERSGKQVRREFCKSNPWAGTPCQRTGCLVCEQEGGEGDCRKRGILYKTTCLQCKGTDKEASYIGESARSGYERGLDHQRDYESMELDSHMMKHQILSHGELQEKLTFKMKILKVHTSAFMRQVHEAVAIEMNEKNNILNSKGGFNRCKLPRLSIKMGQAEVKDGEKVDAMNETEIEQEIERLRKEKKVRKKKEKDLDKSQEPPRKKKRKWNVETGKKRKNPDEIETNERRDLNYSKKFKNDEPEKSHENDNSTKNENPQECLNQKSMKTSQECRPQHIQTQESTIDMSSENFKDNKISKPINYYFENLRKKQELQNNSEFTFSSDNFVKKLNFVPPTCSKKPSSLEIKKGGGLRKSENKANPVHSPSPPTNHQLKKKTSSRKKVKWPCYNYKPINHFFPPQDTEAIRKTAGNSDPSEVIKAGKF